MGNPESLEQPPALEHVDDYATGGADARLGERCDNCGCYHSDTAIANGIQQAEFYREMCKQFDPKAACMMCGHPVHVLSMGGPRICPPCDCGELVRGRPRTREQLDKLIELIRRA